MPWVAAVFAAGCAAGAWQRSRRSPTKVRRAADDDGSGIVYRGERAPITDEGFRWVEAVLPTEQQDCDLSPEELESWLDARCEKLKTMIPSTDEDFDDEVAELHWQWARPLLPFVDRARINMATYKRNTVLRNKSFFEKVKLFKPLAIKYPTLLRSMLANPSFDHQDKKYVLNTEFIYREEKYAGFTYEDFIKETGGNKFDKWEQPEVGETVTGKVVAFSERGEAFVEIGGKTWAVMPLENISFAPISKPDEVLNIGDVIDAEIVDVGADSAVSGDMTAKQVVLSRTKIERAKAWEEVEKIMRGEPGVKQTVNVVVTGLNQQGATVQAESGLVGFIRSNELADKAEDPRIVGTTLVVEIKSIDTPMFESGKTPYGQHYIYFSYANVATKELAREVNVYDILDGVVKETEDIMAQVQLSGGVVCKLRKMDVSGAVANYSLRDAFQEGEEIKVVVINLDANSGEVRIATRPLEPRKGMFLNERQKCYDMAEDTVKRFAEFAEKQKADVAGRVLGGLMDDDDEKPSKPAGKTNIIGNLDDDEEDLGF